MKVRWSTPAAEDLEHICAWIEGDNPAAARRVAQTIYYGCAQLKHFPNMGSESTRMIGRRELIFPALPVIVVYQVKQDAVEISRIFHGAQDWPQHHPIPCAPFIAASLRRVGRNQIYFASFLKIDSAK